MQSDTPREAGVTYTAHHTHSLSLVASYVKTLSQLMFDTDKSSVSNTMPYVSSCPDW